MNHTDITSELAKISVLLAEGRKYGVFITARPEVIQAIRQSGHKDARTVASNLCPVTSDPWTARV